jgi:hemerythrin superfamily protein
MPNPLQEIASKTMGAVKATQATFEGLTGVFRHLAREHGEVAVMIKRLKGNSDLEARRDLYPEIRRQLLSHEKAELSEVYPSLSAFEETRHIAAEHAADAGRLEAAIKTLDDMAYEDVTWPAAFDRLATLVEQHVTEEEDVYFPIAQNVLGEEQAKILQSRFEATKSAVLDRLGALS